MLIDRSRRRRGGRDGGAAGRAEREPDGAERDVAAAAHRSGQGWKRTVAGGARHGHGARGPDRGACLLTYFSLLILVCYPRWELLRGRCASRQVMVPQRSNARP